MRYRTKEYTCLFYGLIPEYETLPAITAISFFFLPSLHGN